MSEDDAANAGIEVAPTDDPLTLALQQAQKQAEARKAIADAMFATGKAMVPTLPTELGATLDATGAGTNFGTVNCYRAALWCTKAIAAEVAPKVGQGAVVWVTAGPANRSPNASLSVVRYLLGELKARLTFTVTLLDSPPDAIPTAPTPPTFTPGQPRATESDLGVMTIAGLVSAGLSVAAGLLSSKVTMKSASTDLDDDAVVDMMTRELLDEGCRVVRPDPNTPIDTGLAADVALVQTLADDVRTGSWKTVVAAQAAAMEISKRATERDVLRLKVENLAKGSGKDFTPDLSADIQRIVTLAGEIAEYERTKVSLDGRLADALTVVEAAKHALDILHATGDDGFSPLTYASAAAAFEGAEPLWRLEAAAVSAGADSQFHDRKVRSDFAIHTGSATVTYRLLDSTGEVRGAQTFVRVASSRVGLDDGTLTWIPGPQ